MLKVNVVSFQELSEQEQKLQPNNGCGKEYANYIKITDGSETVMILSDAVEPEDATFRRDFSNVVSAIKKAYEIGIRDGKRLNCEDYHWLMERAERVEELEKDLNEWQNEALRWIKLFEEYQELNKRYREALEHIERIQSVDVAQQIARQALEGKMI